MDCGDAGGPWRPSIWPPSWILTKIRNNYITEDIEIF